MPYIDRDKLIKELSTMYKSPTSAEDFMTVGYDHAIADVVVTVHEQPTVDVVERRHGEWVHDGGKWKNRYYCSKCFYKLFDEPTNFCPNCGADMRKETENG